MSLCRLPLGALRGGAYFLRPEHQIHQTARTQTSTPRLIYKPRATVWAGVVWLRQYCQRFSSAYSQVFACELKTGSYRYKTEESRKVTGGDMTEEGLSLR